MSGSFESAMTLARMIMDEGDMPLLDRLQDAHEHELDHVGKSRFHEGYVAGQHSMDAEHYAVALRLRALPLDGDTQENLAQIARAVWHSDFGWTDGACKALRDELVRLLGGVSERPYTTIDELQAKLEEAEFAIANWREREKSFDESERLREELRRERDELRERLDRVADALRGVERGTMSAWEAADEVGRSSPHG